MVDGEALQHKISRVIPVRQSDDLAKDAVYAIDPLHDPRWLELVSRHTSASVFHTRGWLRALQKTYGYEPIAFTLSAPSEALKSAVVFCIVRSWLTGNRLVSLPFSDHCEPLVEHPEQFRTLSDFVKRVRSQERWKYVELRSADSFLNFDRSFSKSHDLLPTPARSSTQPRSVV